MSKLIQNVLWALMGAAIAGGVFVLLQRPQQADITILLPTPEASGPVQVYVTGAVSSPGLYTLPANSRVSDLLSAAGGALPDADLVQVNLARLLRDGEQVHVPAMGEAGSPQAAGGGEPAGPAAGGKVNINVATQEGLESLPGIGEVRAQAILDYRRQNGPFRRPDELMQVPGIGAATYERIKDRVTVG